MNIWNYWVAYKELHLNKILCFCTTNLNSTSFYNFHACFPNQEGKHYDRVGRLSHRLAPSFQVQLMVSSSRARAPALHAARFHLAAVSYVGLNTSGRHCLTASQFPPTLRQGLSYKFVGRCHAGPAKFLRDTFTNCQQSARCRRAGSYSCSALNFL